MGYSPGGREASDTAKHPCRHTLWERRDIFLPRLPAHQHTSRKSWLDPEFQDKGYRKGSCLSSAITDPSGKPGGQEPDTVHPGTQPLLVSHRGASLSSFPLNRNPFVLCLPANSLSSFQLPGLRSVRSGPSAPSRVWHPLPRPRLPCIAGLHAVYESE